MAYTPVTIHSGNQSGQYSTKNAQDLATVLEAMDTALGAAGDVSNGASALTDSTTGSASTTLAAGVGVSTISIPLTLSTLSNADVVTTYTPGYKFKILSVDFVVSVPASTGGKAADLNLEIGTTNLTGGVVSLTTATVTPLGAVIAGTAVTAANTGAANATISVEASGVTAFVEGTGFLLIKIQNMDTADAVASLSAQSNHLNTAVDAVIATLA